LYTTCDVRYYAENIWISVVYVNRYIGDINENSTCNKGVSLVAFDVASDVYRCQSGVNLLISSTPCRYNLWYVCSCWL